MSDFNNRFGYPFRSATLVVIESFWKLKPKKEHTGYLVVFSGEKEHQFKDGNRRVKRVLLWETVIQSPYVVD